MKNKLSKIGICDPSFILAQVKELIEKGVLDKPLDGNHGEIHPKGDDFVESGIPFIMASDINDGIVDYKNCNFITKKQADSLRKGFAINGDVLLTHKATIGRTAIVNYFKHPYVMLTPQVTYYRVIDPKKLSNLYLLYYFESSFFQDILKLWAGSGSTRAYLGITEQQKLPIIFPPIDKQRKIAAVLSAYDGLIKNNQCRIILLEKMVEEIYREWFVRLRFPGHKQTKFVKGVPVEWVFDKGSEFFNVVKGKSYSSDELTENLEHMPFITLKSFNRGGGYREDGLKYYSGRYAENQVVRLNDIVMAVTDMTQDRVVVGRVARVPDFGSRGAVISLDVIKLVPKKVIGIFLYNYMRHSGFGDFIKEFANGANVLHLKSDLVPRQKIVMPPKHLQEEFAKKVEPIYKHIDMLSVSNDRLKNLRNLLLPRLISGRLSLDDLKISISQKMQETLYDETAFKQESSEGIAYLQTMCGR